MDFKKMASLASIQAKTESGATYDNDANYEVDENENLAAQETNNALWHRKKNSNSGVDKCSDVGNDRGGISAIIVAAIWIGVS